MITHCTGCPQFKHTVVDGLMVSVQERYECGFQAENVTIIESHLKQYGIELVSYKLRGDHLGLKVKDYTSECPICERIHGKNRKTHFYCFLTEKEAMLNCSRNTERCRIQKIAIIPNENKQEYIINDQLDYTEPGYQYC